MDWFSLIPAGLGLLGGIFGGGNKSTTQTRLPPETQKLVDQALKKAKGIWGQKYAAYGGDRVADPTASREQLTPLMGSIGNRVQGGMDDASGYRARIADMMNAGRSRVTAPSMVQGGPRATYSGPATVAPVPRDIPSAWPTPPTGTGRPRPFSDPRQFSGPRQNPPIPGGTF